MSNSEAQHPPVATAASIHVLVVDDNPANRQAFESVLRPLGYSVSVADSGRRALELADRCRFTVIVLDVRMPMMNGLETAAELRKKPLSRATPIVFVSTYEETQIEVSRATLEGMTDFISSPVKAETLIWKVRNWVQVGVLQEMLRRLAARVPDTQEALHHLLAKVPALQPEPGEDEPRLVSALKTFVQILSEPQGLCF